MSRVLRIPIAVAVALTVALAAAAPATFVFDTSGFDFTDTSLTAGTVAFSLSGDQLQIDLASSGLTSSIPAVTLSVPAATTDRTGRTVYPTLRDLGDLTLTGNGGQVTGITLMHESIGLDAVADAYVGSLTALGFTASQEPSPSANLLVYTFDNGSVQLRAVFHRVGPDVSAHLSGPASAG